MDFPERDWKHLRALHPVALARYCDRILAEVATIIKDDSLPAHERYLQLADGIRDHNRRMADAFDDMRRSRAIQRLSAMVSLQLVTEEELALFTPATRASALSLSYLSESSVDTAG